MWSPPDSDPRRLIRWMVGVPLACWITLGTEVHAQSTARPASTGDAVTYSGDVAAILNENCVVCHRPGSIGPMGLTSYEDVLPWTELIKAKVQSREMPPWFINRTIGIQEFENDISLTEDEVRTIVRWVDAGAPPGDLAAAPPPPEFASDQVWQLEERFGRPPDLILRSIPQDVPADGQDLWVEQVTYVEGIDEPRWAAAIEPRAADPDYDYIFHHLNTFTASDRSESALLAHWNVGKPYDLYPEDAGRLLEPGAEIRWDQHLFPLGRAVEGAQVEMGVWLYPPGYEPDLGGASEELFRVDSDFEYLRGQEIMIPPEGFMTIQGTHVLDQPLRIHSVQIHMHQRGKSQTLEAIYPDGRREVLNQLVHNHRWLTTYVYEEDARPLLPKGTVLLITTQFDNTAENPANPDPNQWVFFGRRTVDEMSHMWIGTTWLTHDQYEHLVSEREARPNVQE